MKIEEPLEEPCIFAVIGLWKHLTDHGDEAFYLHGNVAFLLSSLGKRFNHCAKAITSGHCNSTLLW
jgi:hypothetical protein